MEDVKYKNLVTISKYCCEKLVDWHQADLNTWAARMIIFGENFRKKILCEVNFVHYEAFVADKNFVSAL